MFTFFNGIRFLVCILPSYLFGLGLTYFFRHIDPKTQFNFTALLIVGCLYLVYKLRQPYVKEDNDEADRMPFFLHGSMYLFLLLSSIGGFFWSYMAFKTDINFDNGRNTPVVITEDSYGKQIIPAKSSRGFVLPIDVNHILIDGKAKTIDLTKKGSWIFNIDKLNTYIEATVKYKTMNNSSPEQAEFPGLEPEPEPTLIADELFLTKAELLFTAPDTLRVKEAEARKLLSKIVLYRVNVDKNTGTIAILN